MSACQVKWCRSDQPATHHLNENMDDGCWRFGICETCWTVCNYPNEDSDHTFGQQRKLRAYWRTPPKAQL